MFFLIAPPCQKWNIGRENIVQPQSRTTVRGGGHAYRVRMRGSRRSAANGQRTEPRITNIPTDLLRTFVLVVELRSFTRAAKAQGMTQPAVSAQIRRLQFLLGVELFDKSAPGVALTPVGEHVVGSARRLLSVNDHILQIANPQATAQLVRIGIPGDCVGAELESLLAAGLARWPNLRFTVEAGGQRTFFQRLKQSDVDLVMMLVDEAPNDAARHYWAEKLVWVGSKATRIVPGQPVPIVSYRDGGLFHRVAKNALDDIARNSELVFTARTAEALRSAVTAGLGVMVVAKNRIPPELDVIDDGSLPALPNTYCGIFVREGAKNEALDHLADFLAQSMRPAAEPLRFTSPRPSTVGVARHSA
jgi:DNA-binding transcriptional LysR family regulator